VEEIVEVEKEEKEELEKGEEEEGVKPVLRIKLSTVVAAITQRLNLQEMGESL
jgi:hypothetical protein